MADIFNFGGFLKKVNKKREDDAGLNEPAAPSAPPTEKQPESTMSQGDFSYGPTGMTRKKKQ